DPLVRLAPDVTVTVPDPLYCPDPDSAAVTFTFPLPWIIPLSTRVGTDSAGTSDSVPCTSMVDGPLIDAPLFRSTSPPASSVDDEISMMFAREFRSLLLPPSSGSPEVMLLAPVSLVTMHEWSGPPIGAGWVFPPAAAPVPELVNTPAGTPGSPGDGGPPHPPY